MQVSEHSSAAICPRIHPFLDTVEIEEDSISVYLCDHISRTYIRTPTLSLFLWLHEQMIDFYKDFGAEPRYVCVLQKYN